MLEEDYYLANFRSLITFVGQTYQGLLSEAELRWYAAFLGVSEPSQRLYVRLIGRRAALFRLSKLRYPEIASISTAAAELCANGLGIGDAPQHLHDLLPVFTKPELVKLLNLQAVRQLSRGEIEDYIVDRDYPSDLLTLQQHDAWFAVAGLSEYTVFKLCFFGNCYQDMSEFVLRDLGVFQYEQYRIDKQSRVFQSREQIDAHLQCFDCATMLDQVDHQDAHALLDVDKALPEIKTHDAHLTRRVDRLHNVIARQLERIGHLEDALDRYRQSERPPSRERQVRVLMKLDRPQEAHALCTAIMAQPYASEEVQFVETIQPKLHKLLQLPMPSKPRFRPLTTKLTLSAGDARVESIACDFYKQFGECFYVENALINGVLGLFIWDIIFAPVDGVFYNPFQSAPADFYQPEFLQARAALLENRFLELDEPLRFSARVWERFEISKGISNPLVSWHSLSEALLSLALIRIPVADWRRMFSRMLDDLRNHTSGLPDLILFPRDGSYEMLEIKGPGDAVQKNQRRWMAYFAEHRIPYRVVHISWASQVTSA